MNLGEIRALLKKYNQEQLLNGYEKLDERKQKQLLEQIQNIDFELVNSLYLTTKQEQKQSSDEITPIEYMDKYKLYYKTPDNFTDIVMSGDGEYLTGLWFLVTK